MLRFLCMFFLVWGGLIGSAWSATVNVVTTTTDLAAIARAVGGKDVAVRSLTSGASDPHYLAAKPSMIRAIYEADLLLLNGAELESGWLPAAVQAGRNPRVQPGRPGYLDLSEAVRLLKVPEGPITRAMGDVHPSGNPHYMLDPRNGARVATAVAERLKAIDPTHADAYQARLETFLDALNRRFADWRDRLAFLQGRKAISYHKSLSYLADAFGFEIVDQVEPLPGISPTVSHLQGLIARIQAEQIGLLVMEAFYERRSSDFLNKQTGIRAVVLPTMVGATPGIETYFDLFEAIVDALKESGGKT
ncbi:MAG: metal ABC transporter substrate-binding protein [Pseudomonadota bacterium]